MQVRGGMSGSFPSWFWLVALLVANGCLVWNCLEGTTPLKDDFSQSAAERATCLPMQPATETLNQCAAPDLNVENLGERNSLLVYKADANGEGKADKDFAKHFSHYASLAQQKQMLSDGVRMDAYYHAIFKNARHFKGKVIAPIFILSTICIILILWC